MITKQVYHNCSQGKPVDILSRSAHGRPRGRSLPFLRSIDPDRLYLMHNLWELPSTTLWALP